MKKKILNLLVMFIGLSLSAGNLTDEADTAYSEKDYQRAIKLYNQALSEEGSSSVLYYNLGNAYYRADSLARAIISYERALKLDPTNSDARTNLNFVNTKIIDTPIDRSSYSTMFVDKALSTMTPNSWAVVSVILFAAMLSLAGGYIFSSRVRTKKICFFGGIAMLFISGGAIAISIYGASRAESRDQAVITSTSTQLSTSPAVPLTTQQQAFLLHEGSKVEIVDSVSTPLDPANPKWYEVKIDNEHRAWVSGNDIEII